ncbi:hypothetical protein [Methylobacterium flocculans]|uniref:hypothetical protein n=1 Tax=Methylobacterium flocculans TaxID=2984843 RepID=UPI0021F331BE|nr:hypothetical protein [Methylobacterium sp. FF17]
MDMLKRANARLAGARLYLLAFIFTLPDILSALVGFDWTPLLPAGYEGLGVRIGAGLSLARLVLVPALKSMRDAARRSGPDEGPR